MQLDTVWLHYRYRKNAKNKFIVFASLFARLYTLILGMAYEALQKLTYSAKLVPLQQGVQHRRFLWSFLFSNIFALLLLCLVHFVYQHLEIFSLKYMYVEPAACNFIFPYAVIVRKPAVCLIMWYRPKGLKV